ncbi:MAG: M28 family metallopeptidase [Defluviitaleaceae bacterium]|nr:M28 family metallopeptidase [Defluviitaleaceae bacterium]
MTRKNIFIISSVIAILLVGVAYGNHHFRGATGEVTPDGAYISEENDYTPEPSPTPYEPYEYTGPELSYDPPSYHFEEELEGYEGDTSSSWHPFHFRNVRQPQPLDENTPHGAIAVRHIRHLNDHYYSRFPFSYQEKRAAIWIVGELLAMGYTWDDIDVQEFDIYDVNHSSASAARWHNFGTVIHDYDYMRDTYLSQNVILTVPGESSQVIVVGAHYDTLLYPGASDNASGTALLLESAQRMLNTDNYYTIVYVFFGAEEVGLLGAHFFVDNLSDEELSNIIFMVNADVLFEGPYFIFGGGYQVPGSWSPRSNAISRQWEELAGYLNFSQGLELISDPYSIFLSSDQRVFMEAGFTVMMLFGTDFHPSGDFYFRVFHSYRDDFHYIMDRWPDKIDDAMRTFSIFLEEVLLAMY